MRVVVTLEARFQGTPDGKIWCDGRFPFPYEFWRRYLTAFDEVLVVARVAPVPAVPRDAKEVTGGQVRVHALPHYLGPWEYVLQMQQLRRRLQELVLPGQAYILRLGSPIADILRPMLRSLPYGVEVVGDPWEMFGPGGIRHPLRPLFRLWFTWQLKRQCSKAIAASYVTERLLQNRYPAPNAKVTIAASSIMLTDEAFAQAPRIYGKLTSPKLITVGSLEHPHKGTDLLLEAVSLLHKKGVKAQLTLLGDGKMRKDFEALARNLDLVEHVKFLGAVPAGKDVRRMVAESDIFVLPSRADGLPRAMIEAMAQGLFCIGSDMGGMKELLPSEWRCPVNRADLLAEKILKALENPDVMSSEARANHRRARDFHRDVLDERRLRFYRTLRDEVQ